jgi:hypothetical protein
MAGGRARAVCREDGQSGFDLAWGGTVRRVNVWCYVSMHERPII